MLPDSSLHQRPYLRVQTDTYTAKIIVKRIDVMYADVLKCLRNRDFQMQNHTVSMLNHVSLEITPKLYKNLRLRQTCVIFTLRGCDYYTGTAATKRLHYWMGKITQTRCHIAFFHDAIISFATLPDFVVIDRAITYRPAMFDFMQSFAQAAAVYPYFSGFPVFGKFNYLYKTCIIN